VPHPRVCKKHEHCTNCETDRHENRQPEKALRRSATAVSHGRTPANRARSGPRPAPARVHATRPRVGDGGRNATLTSSATLMRSCAITSRSRH
jgi:hypothetical protein